MKTIRLLFLLILSLSQPGCMTMMTLDAAKSSPHEDDQGHTFRKAEPAYYLLVLLAVPADIATLPCQYLLAYLIKASCSCM